jgi:hypothetical protein
VSPRTLWIPAETLNAARLIAYAVEAGRLRMLPHYLTEEAAEIRAAFMGQVHARTIPVFAIVMEKRATHDGFIPVAWPVDRVGDVAAAITLFAMGAVVALASCWEHFA